MNITLWYKQNEKKEWIYNHYFVGYDSVTKPTPLHENHVKTWKSGKWACADARMVDSVIIDIQPMVECL